MSKSRLRNYLVAASLVALAAATSIATFSDGNCQQSYRTINGPDGYPNGTCTPLVVDGPFSSFQVVGEDAGCTVTIYANDTDPSESCSATVLQFAEVAKCYNASWVYYSIDACSPPSASSSSVTSPTAAATSSASSIYHSNRTGAIVGGVVGGVGGLVLLSALGCFFFLRRRRRRRQEAQELPQPEESPQPELGDAGIREMQGKDAKTELPGSHLYVSELPENVQAQRQAEEPRDEKQEEKQPVVIVPSTPTELEGNNSWFPGDDTLSTLRDHLPT